MATVISSKIARQARIPILPLTSTPSRGVTADGSTIIFTGTARLQLRFPQEPRLAQMSVDAFVTPTPIHATDILLGLPFLTQHEATFTTNGVYLDDVLIPYAASSSSSSSTNPAENGQPSVELLSVLSITIVGATPTTTTSMPTHIPSDLLATFPDVFASPSGVPLPGQQPFEASIQLKPNAIPVARRHYPIAPKHRDALLEKLRTYESKGWIVPSSSPWAAPVLCVPKPNGDIRVVVDYRGLNQQTVIPEFPLPTFDDLIECLPKATVFTKIDLDSGYHQMGLAAPSRPLTAFVSPFGKHEWTVLPQGISGGVPEFHRMTSTVLREFIGKCCLVFLDDFLIYSETETDHVNIHVPAVLAALSRANLHVALHKFQYCKSSVDFLGHTITHGQISPLTSNVDPIINFPVPDTPEAVRRFVAMVGYYRRFIRAFADIAAPLHALQNDTRKYIDLTPIELAAFHKLRTSLMSSDVLKIFDPDAIATRLQTDASQVALGVVLEQQFQAEAPFHPVLFHSRKLTPAETNYSATDRELLAIVDFLRKHQHLTPRNNKIQVLTDHAILQHLQSKPVLRPREQGWLDVLSSTFLEIVYRRGSEQVVPDALSRILIAPIATSPFTDDSTIRSLLLDALAKHPKFSIVVSNLKAGLTMPAFVLDNDLLYLTAPTQNRLVVLHPRLQRWLLSSYHDGHPGINAMYLSLQKFFYWPRLRDDVIAYVTGCQECQFSMQRQHLPPTVIEPPPPERWSEISIDYAMGLPPAGPEGLDQIAVVVDRLSHRVVVYPAKTSDTADVAAGRFLQYIIAYFGWPTTIISDHDKIFMSKFWTTLCKLSRIKMRMASVGHHRGNGSAENAIKRLRDKLRKHAIQFDENWPMYLPSIMIALNKYVSPTLGFSAFQLDTGRPFFSPTDRFLGHNIGHSLVDEHNIILKAASDRHIATQVTNLSTPPAERQHPILSPLHHGDKVLLSTAIVTPPQSQAFLKLKSLWIGPFTVASTDQFHHVTLTDLPRNWKLTMPVHRDFVRPYNPIWLNDQTRPSSLPYLGGWLGSDTRSWILKEIVSHSDQRDVRLYYVEFASPTGEFGWLRAEDIPANLVSAYDELHPRNGFFNPVGGYRGQDLTADDHQGDSNYNPSSSSTRGRGRPNRRGGMKGYKN